MKKEILLVVLLLFINCALVDNEQSNDSYYWLRVINKSNYIVSMIELNMMCVDSLFIESLIQDEISDYKLFDAKIDSGDNIPVSFGCTSICFMISGVKKYYGCIEHEFFGGKVASYTIFNDTSYFVIDGLP